MGGAWLFLVERFVWLLTRPEPCEQIPKKSTFSVCFSPVLALWAVGSVFFLSFSPAQIAWPRPPKLFFFNLLHVGPSKPIKNLDFCGTSIFQTPGFLGMKSLGFSMVFGVTPAFLPAQDVHPSSHLRCRGASAQMDAERGQAEHDLPENQFFFA